MAEEDGGHESGGNDRIWPFGRFERATEMPAMWYLLCQKRNGACGKVLTMGKGETSSQHQTLETIYTFSQ